MNKDSNFKNKMIIPIINQEKSLNILLSIPKERISHSWWSLQALKARKEDLECFSLTISSFMVPFPWFPFQVTLFSLPYSFYLT